MNDPVNLSKLDMKYLSMVSEDGTLKYDFMMSLEKIVMAKIAISLWMNQNTQQDILDMKEDHNKDWSDVENGIFGKIPQLSLPNYIVQKLVYTITVVGESMLNWIWYFNNHILIPKISESEYSAVDLINNIAWTTKGRIDCHQTAKNILANQDICLRYYHKYKLACNHCLENEIALLSPQIGIYDLKELRIDHHPMVWFWKAHVENDMTILEHAEYAYDTNRRNRDTSINEHIMQLLVKEKDDTVNDIPINFMWNKLSENEKAKNIKYFVKRLSAHNQNFIFSLLSNLDYDIQQNVFKECFKVVLDGILYDWWQWGEYFLPTILHMLDIMDPQSYWELLCCVHNQNPFSFKKKCKYLRDQYKSLFKHLWIECPMRFKKYIIQLDGRSEFADLVRNLSWKKDWDVIEIIMNDLNAQEKKNIIFGNYGTRSYIILDSIILFLILMEIFFMVY